jgi:hypothetical protein
MGKYLKRFQLGRKNKVSKGNKKLENKTEVFLSILEPNYNSIFLIDQNLYDAKNLNTIICISVGLFFSL